MEILDLPPGLWSRGLQSPTRPGLARPGPARSAAPSGWRALDLSHMPLSQPKTWLGQYFPLGILASAKASGSVLNLEAEVTATRGLISACVGGVGAASICSSPPQCLTLHQRLALGAMAGAARHRIPGVEEGRGGDAVAHPQAPMRWQESGWAAPSPCPTRPEGH